MQLGVARAGSDVHEGGTDEALRRFKARPAVATAHEGGMALQVPEGLGNGAVVPGQHLLRRGGVAEEADEADPLGGREREVEAGPALAGGPGHKAPAISWRPAVQHRAQVLGGDLARQPERLGTLPRPVAALFARARSTRRWRRTTSAGSSAPTRAESMAIVSMSGHRRRNARSARKRSMDTASGLRNKSPATSRAAAALPARRPDEARRHGR